MTPKPTAWGTRRRAGNVPVGPLTALLWLAVAWLPTAAAWGQFRAPEPLTQMRVELPIFDPSGGRAGRQGFTLAAEFSGLFGVGYAGVVIDLQSTGGALPASRQLVLRLTPLGRHLPANQAVAVRLPIEFPQGQSRVRMQRLFPKWTLGDTFRVEVYEDGLPLAGYAAEVGSTVPTYALQSPVTVMPDEIRNNVLLIDTGVERLPESPVQNLMFGRPSTAWQQTRWDELPTDWRLLRDIDCLVIPQDRLRQYAELGEADGSASADAMATDRERYLAIRDWLLMGGVLVIVEAPERQELQALLGLTLSDGEEEAEAFRGEIATVIAEARNLAASLEQLLVELKSMPPGAAGLPNFNALSPLPGSAQTVPADVPPRPTPQQIESAPAWINTFRESTDAFRADWADSYRGAVGAGHVIGVTSKTLRLPHAAMVLRRSADFRQSRLLTRGVDPLMGDARSGNWLIPGVAEPPVYSFIAILTLFVLLVGPVAYRWTTRGHRSHLMFLIAPSLALLTTVSMFAYSILADGFGTMVRVRQLTWLDGASGDAAERTRLTLFSGISPSEGLRFDAAEELLPYPSGDSQGWRTLPVEVDNARLALTNDGESQRFSPAILPSRTQSQFVTHRIRRRLGHISVTDVTPADAADPNAATVTINNGLPFPLEELVVCTADGRYWFAERVDPGNASPAARIPSIQETSKRLGALFNRFRLNEAVIQTGRSSRGQEIRDLISYINRQVELRAPITDGAFEHWLNDRLSIRGELPAGTFVAVAAPSPDVIPVDGARPVDSIRYVMGTLR